jgi:hypothetical protein
VVVGSRKKKKGGGGGKEAGKRKGSWKGGTLGCGYELKKNETPLECLRRMESEREF